MSDDLQVTTLKKLNGKLREKDLSLTIYTVGEFALKCHKLKGVTYDIDAFYISNEDIEKSIVEVEPNELKDNLVHGEHWLNQAVDYLKDPNVKNPGKENSSLFLNLSNLKVYIANEDYLLVMKIIAFHDKKPDFVKHAIDIASILRGNRSFNDKKAIENMFYDFDIDPSPYSEDIDQLLDNAK